MIGATLLGTLLEPTFGSAGRRDRHRRRDRRVLRVRRGRAEDVRGAAHRPRRAARLAASSCSSRASRRCACSSRGLHRPRERRAARARACRRARSSPRRRSSRWPTSPPRRRRSSRGARAHPLDLRVRRHGRARGDAAAPRHGRGRGRRDRRRGDRRSRSRPASRACPRTTRRTDDIIGLVFLKDLVARSARGEGNEPVRARAARRALRAGVEARRRAAARDADREVPHGDRRSTSTAAPPGSSRWRTCSRRSSARSPTSTTSRSPASSSSPSGALRVPGPHADRRGERGARRRAARRRSGTRSAGSCSTRSGTSRSRASACAFEGLEFCAERVQGRRIVSVLITPLDGPTDEPTRPSRRSSRRPRERAGDVPVGVRRRSSAGRTSGSRRWSTSSSAEGVDRLRPAADDAHAGPRRAHHRRHPDRVPRHARASTSRARCSASAPTSARSRRSARSTSCASSIEADAPIGRGDRFIAELVAAGRDAGGARREQGRPAPSRDADRRAARPSRRPSSATSTRYVPLSARTGDGRRRAARRARGAAARGPALLPGRRRDRPARGVPRGRAAARAAARGRARRAAALDRGDHRGDRGTRTTDGRRRCSTSAPCVVRVERDSQKGIVIGQGRRVLRRTRAPRPASSSRRCSASRVHLETHVRVDRDWQRRAARPRPPRALRPLARPVRVATTRTSASQSCDPANRPV